MSTRQRPVVDGPANQDEAAFVWQVMAMFSFDANDDLFWRVDDGHMSMHANCGDVFAWGGSALEEIKPENFAELERARTDANDAAGEPTHEWPMLFVARVRGLRPQGAMYRHIRPELHDLFDECGPVRQVGLGNPVGRETNLTASKEQQERQGD